MPRGQVWSEELRVKGEGLRVGGSGWSGGFDLLWGLRAKPHHPTNRCALVPPPQGGGELMVLGSEALSAMNRCTSSSCSTVSLRLLFFGPRF